VRGLIIGCGSIGTLYDSPKSDMVLTHAHAFALNPNITEYALVDNNEEVLKMSCETWGVKGFLNLFEAFRDFLPDIVCIATPPQARREIFQKIIGTNIKNIICEKPLSDSYESGLEIQKMIEEHDLLVNINYVRRFDPQVTSLKKIIQDKEFGSLQAVRCVYTKGVVNSGSHMLNLLQFLLGNYKNGKVYSGFVDYDKNDPSLNCYLNFQQCSNVQLMAVNQKDYFLFEYEFFFQKKRIAFSNRGYEFKVQEIREDPIFSGYIDLDLGVVEKTQLDESLKSLLENTIDASSSSELISPVGEALLSLKICLDLKKNYEELKSWQN